MPTCAFGIGRGCGGGGGGRKYVAGDGLTTAIVGPDTQRPHARPTHTHTLEQSLATDVCVCVYNYYNVGYVCA